jgi:NAD(P)H-hydrate repair Nnr-like enzyme with NAD(P)H-hydrate epimerase domain
MKKDAIDPLTLGVGLAATVASTAIGLKEVGARKALMAALQKEQAQKKKLIAALVGIGGAGAGAGYVAAKKPAEKTEQTTVLQPIVMEQAKAAREMLKDAVVRRKSEGDRKKLHTMVRPFGKVYKTKKAKGWDVMVDAMLGDTSSTGAGH